MTRIYIAYSASGEARYTFARMDWQAQPISVLVAFPYLNKFNEAIARHNMKPPFLMLDSGAFSAYNSGKEIDIEALIEETKEPRWSESVCLDVIGDAEGSLKNALYMKARGSPALPVFHYGEPWDILRAYCEQFDKVGLSCRFGEKVTDSLRWLEQCFARHWPKKFHSFGWVSEAMLMTFPFHSADTASWNNGPARFGRWEAFGGSLPLRGVRKDLRVEIDVRLKLQRKLEARWGRELSRWSK